VWRPSVLHTMTSISPARVADAVASGWGALDGALLNGDARAARLAEDDAPAQAQHATAARLEPEAALGVRHLLDEALVERVPEPGRDLRDVAAGADRRAARRSTGACGTSERGGEDVAAGGSAVEAHQGGVPDAAAHKTRATRTAVPLHPPLWSATWCVEPSPPRAGCRARARPAAASPTSLAEGACLPRSTGCGSCDDGVPDAGRDGRRTRRPQGDRGPRRVRRLPRACGRRPRRRRAVPGNMRREDRESTPTSGCPPRRRRRAATRSSCSCTAAAGATRPTGSRRGSTTRSEAWHHNARWFALRGYAVLTYTARGS
jgi:hypothetical protein